MHSLEIVFDHGEMRKKAFVCGCEQCGHLWLSVDNLLPRRCAKCKSMRWNKIPDGKYKHRQSNETVHVAGLDEPRETTYERDDYSQG